MMCEILVIGGGASGMMAAIAAAEAGGNVTVVEKNNLLGRKILITGKGRCNLTNTKGWTEFADHIHPNPQFFKKAFYNFSNISTIEYFNKMGLPTTVGQGQRVFPTSMSAYSVVDVLVSRINQLKINVMTGCDVCGLEKNEKGFFICSYNKMGRNGKKFSVEQIASQVVIIATGGLSYPATGSTGIGYDLAAGLGHKIKDCFPSLTALIPEKYDLRLNGIDINNAGACLYVNKNIAQMELGDISFTDAGIEGPIGFRLSRKAVNALIDGNKVEIIIDLKPSLSLEKLSSRVIRELEQLGWTKEEITPVKMNILLRRFMPRSLIIPFSESQKGLTIYNLPDMLKEWRFVISSYVGYSRAVITAGGVSLDEISSKGMSSKIVEGLFFAGEIIDIDGDTGGYNLQIAFSTGFLAGKSAVQFILKEKSALS